MNPKPIVPKRGPERVIQDALIRFLRERAWIVRETHGNMYQCGFPDLYAAHKRYRTRWIECKYAESYAFTPAQKEFFPQLASVDVGVWVLTAATEEEYQKLFRPMNWYQFLNEAKPHTRRTC